MFGPWSDRNRKMWKVCSFIIILYMWVHTAGDDRIRCSALFTLVPQHFPTVPSLSHTDHMWFRHTVHFDWLVWAFRHQLKWACGQFCSSLLQPKVLFYRQAATSRPSNNGRARGRSVLKLQDPNTEEVWEHGWVNETDEWDTVQQTLQLFVLSRNLKQS